MSGYVDERLGGTQFHLGHIFKKITKDFQGVTVWYVVRGCPFVEIDGCRTHSSRIGCVYALLLL